MSLREKIFYGLLAFAGALCLAWAFFGPRGMRDVAKIKEEQKRVKDEVRVLEDKKEILARQTELMRTDPRLIERRARDTLGMVKGDETVIMIPGNRKNAD